MGRQAAIRERTKLDAQHLFRCAGCKRVVLWSKGCADNLPDHCDDCWVLYEQAAELCSMYAFICTRGPEEDRTMFGSPDARTDRIACKALTEAAGEYTELVNSTDKVWRPEVHWALAECLLRTGQVTP